MNNSSLVIGTLIGLLSIIPATANAELIDRGNGVIYDSAQNLTWTQNADINGKMNWVAAMQWAEELEYAGFNDWRLPKTTQFDDPSCLEDERGTIYRVPLFYEHHANCQNGEMEQLTLSSDPYNNPIFENISTTRYWAATIYRDEMDPCVAEGTCVIENDTGERLDFYWQWSFKDYYKTTLRGGNNRPAWAVRDGDTIASDSPGTLSDNGNNIHIPSLYYQLTNRTDNIWIDLTYVRPSPDGESLWKLTGIAYNAPALSGPLTGTVSEAFIIQVPEIIFQNTSYWATFEYYGSEGGEFLWELKAYGPNE